MAAARSSNPYPVDYFHNDQWPDGTPPPGTPIEALYGALMARAVATELTLLKHREGIAEAPALRLLSATTGVPAGTLHHILIGDRWVRISTLARLEHGLGRRVTGPDLALEYHLRQIRAAEAAAPQPVDRAAP